MGRVRTEGGLGIEGERAAVELGEFKVQATGEDGFGDVGLCDADTHVIVDGQSTASMSSCVAGGNPDKPQWPILDFARWFLSVSRSASNEQSAILWIARWHEGQSMRKSDAEISRSPLLRESGTL